MSKDRLGDFLIFIENKYGGGWSKYDRLKAIHILELMDKDTSTALCTRWGLSGKKYITYKLLAKELGISEGEAIALSERAEKQFINGPLIVHLKSLKGFDSFDDACANYRLLRAIFNQ